MAMSNVVVFVIKLLLFAGFLQSRFNYIRCQECQTEGLKCSDDSSCCGGCCKAGECVATREECEAVQDICLVHYCPPGFQCYIYTPPDCEGCNSTPDCQKMQL